VKPDLAGYANVSTWSYGTGRFNGTSAAAPHVAGAAALVRSGYSSYSGAQVRHYLESNAIDMGQSGKDNDHGHGRLRLGAPPQGSCSFSINPTSASLGHSGGTGTISVTTQAGCAWAVVESLSWVGIDSGQSGTGPGTVSYAVSSNLTSTPRTGTMTVAGRTFTINQSGYSAGSCVPDADTVCLHNGRFKVEVGWRDSQGRFGRANQVPVPSTDSALLWFFNDQNWEMLVKVLNGCGINDRYWVFTAASTNLEYHLEVTDTTTMTVRSYDNPLGTFPLALGDTSAFATCP
jgi:hypothetical protein